jgi:hypothetical protein
MGGGRGTGGGEGRATGGDGGHGAGAGVAKNKGNGAPLKLETIKGEIVQMDDAAAGGRGKSKQGGNRPGPMVSVRTANETVMVHAGAPHFREEQKLDLKAGDMVEITGVRSTKTANMMVAHSITRGTQVVRLRDEQGNKLWKPRQRAQEIARGELAARVVSLDAPPSHSPGSGLGRRSQFIFVRAGNEDLAVEAGPDEFREAQGLALKVDDELTISGWRLPNAQTAGKPVFLAASLTKGKTMVKLRDDNRRPLWKKK